MEDEANNQIEQDSPTSDLKPGLPDGIQSRDLTREMEESYLDYAMSVIVSRALPDVRDGLKPVHRRILYAMHGLGLKSSARYRKSATIVGEVLGKFHPHGDVAVYDSLVRMAQDFSMRYTLVDGQGNFGSMDGDSPAAMRYTESKMDKISDELLTDIEKETVAFVDNYDSTIKEPSVLPAKIPNLLLNGTLGIAVGMATNIPTHNLREVCDAVIKTIDEPEVEIDELLTIMPGPDFPTGGIIYDKNAIRQAYTTGRGSIVVRGVANIEEGKKLTQIIISAIPYQVNKADLITKIADLVRAKKIEGISDIRDESDRKDGVRIAIDLKQNAFANKILNTLYNSTSLQTAFHLNCVALIDGIQPRLLNLKNIIEEFIKHRQNVITLATKFDLKKNQDRLHILEGLKLALDSIDAIINTIRQSQTRADAHVALVSKFKLSDLQAEAILEMKLSALAGLERQKVEDEIEEKIKLIKFLESILADPKKILGIIKDDLEKIKEKYGDDRKTKIIPTPIGNFSVEDFVPNETVIVTLTKSNYIKRVQTQSYRTQNRGGKGIIGMETKDEDTVEYLIMADTHDDIMFFTNLGRIFKSKVYEIPSSSRTAKGQSIANLIQISPDEKVTAVITLNPKKDYSTNYYLMATKKGTVKKTSIEAYRNIRKTGIIAIKLKDNDILKFVHISGGNDNLIMVTKNGQAIYFKESDARPLGRSAAGVRGIRLRENDEMISCDIVKNGEDKDFDILTVLQNGYGKRTNVAKHFHTQNRGGSGLRVSKVNAKTGSVVDAHIVQGDEGDIILISKTGQVIRMPMRSVKRLGRDTMGVTLMRLKSGDKVTSVGFVKSENIEEISGENQETETVNEQSLNKDIPVDKPIIKTIKAKDESLQPKPAKTQLPKSKKGEINYWGKN